MLMTPLFFHELDAYTPNGGKVGWARATTGAIADTDKPIICSVQEVGFDEDVIITSNQDAKRPMISLLRT